MFARYYSPESAFRFLSVDPAAESARPELPQSWNRYAYALNNPIALIDPDGRKDKRTEEDKAILEDDDVKERSRQAWDESDADQKFEEKEVGFRVDETVDAEGNPDYEAGPTQTDRDPAKVDIEITDDTVATVHTHPAKHTKDDKGNTERRTPFPDAQDRKEHDRAQGKTGRVVSYVISEKKLWKYDPQTGKTKAILTGKHFKEYMGRR